MQHLSYETRNFPHAVIDVLDNNLHLHCNFFVKRIYQRFVIIGRSNDNFWIKEK